MRAESFLQQARALPLAEMSTIAGGSHIVVVAPHPDDESLGCGGLIAQATLNRIGVTIVFVSDGTKSHPGSRSHPADDLRRLRMNEATQAAAILGVSSEQLVFLNLPDTAVPTEGEMAMDAWRRIAKVIDETDASSVFVTWPHDPHCDHSASYALTRRAVKSCRNGPRLWTYIVWGWTLPPDHDLPDTAPLGAQLDVSLELPVKLLAVAAHVSQVTDLIADDPDGFRLTDGHIAQFCGPTEIFLEDVP